MTENSGTAPEGNEAPAADNTPVVETGTPAGADEVTKLRSRNAGLDAKVTELINSTKEAQRIAQEAADKLAQYEAGKVGADEALRAQLSAKEAELAQTRLEAKLTRVEAKYPETFGVFGEAAATMSEDQLAAAEARFSGAADSTATGNPRPIGNNQARNESIAPAGGSAKDRIEALKAKIKATPAPWIDD